MSQEHPTEYYRTTNSRVGKMLAIMLAICIVGGVIFSQCGIIGFQNHLM